LNDERLAIVTLLYTVECDEYVAAAVSCHTLFPCSPELYRTVQGQLSTQIRRRTTPLLTTEAAVEW
ncbi:MAG: hypothetical protein AAFR52_12665, partial [Pseudomonadota bacterium]